MINLIIGFGYLKIVDAFDEILLEYQLNRQSDCSNSVGKISQKICGGKVSNK